MKIKKIDTKTWKYFYIGDIFDCQKTQAMILPKDGNYNYVSRSAFNNGVSKFVDLKDRNGENFELNKGNCITIGAEGRIAFYQKDDFIAGVKVYTIRHTKLNEKIALFLCSLLNINATKYKYTEARILDKIKKETIPLPTTQQGEPDWQFMEEYTKQIKAKIEEKIKQCDLIKNKAKKKVDTSTWQEFSLKDLFKIEGTGKEQTTTSQDGNINLISSTGINNGVSKCISNGNKLFSGNKITLAKNGCVGKCFYQKDDFYATSDVFILKGENLNQNIALFIMPIIESVCFNNFSWNDKINNDKFNQLKVKLPTTPDNQPDWQFMEEYIKSLPYGDKI